MKLFSLARGLSRNLRFKIVDCRLLNLGDLGFRCQENEA
jgi:hypothetical protein